MCVYEAGYPHEAWHSEASSLSAVEPYSLSIIAIVFIRAAVTAYKRSWSSGLLTAEFDSTGGESHWTCGHPLRIPVTHPRFRVPGCTSCSFVCKSALILHGLVVLGSAGVYRLWKVSWRENFICASVRKLSSILGWDFPVMHLLWGHPCSVSKPNKHWFSKLDFGRFELCLWNPRRLGDGSVDCLFTTPQRTDPHTNEVETLV